MEVVGDTGWTSVDLILPLLRLVWIVGEDVVGVVGVLFGGGAVCEEEACDTGKSCSFFHHRWLHPSFNSASKKLPTRSITSNPDSPQGKRKKERPYSLRASHKSSISPLEGRG